VPARLQDEGMNSLLPFGEYVSPKQRAAETATLETWELERLLLRLAAAGQREHRHHRGSRHGSSSASRHQRQSSRGEPSAPQPIRDPSSGVDAGISMPWLLPSEGGSGRAPAAARPASVPSQGVYPGSWPPAGALEAGSTMASASSSMRDDGHVVSPRSRSGSVSFKSRLASLRLK
jgi:hypothetical protein